VKKIVIKTNRQGPHYFLLAMLNRLFPDCEIQIVKERDDHLDYNDPTINRRATHSKTNSIGLP
jgi:hypothetical protein